MKAIRIHEFGGPEVLKYEEAPRPTPGDGEVLIKVFACGVNPIDWKIRAGNAKQKFPVTFPLIPGWDVSGEIEAVGSGVLNFRVGDEVYSKCDTSRNGAYAEFVVVKAGEVNAKPKSIGHEKASAIPLAGLTAWQALFNHGNLEAGQKVLIHAASGGVGSYAVQFAKWKGAHIIGTSSKENMEFVRSLGADEVIDYNAEKFDEAINDVDLVIDLVGGDTQKRSLAVVTKGGKIVTTVKPEIEKQAKGEGKELKSFMMTASREQLQQIADLIDSGKVKPVVSEILPLKEAATAHKKIEQGHTRGKIILKVV